MRKKMFFFMLCIIPLFLFPTLCTDGAKDGLLLWFNTIIPAIFPFLLITNFLKEYDGIAFFEKYLGSIVSLIFRCSRGGAYAIIFGLLCGYPMGAKAITDCLSKDHISHDEAEYLLTFCNNPSPMYMINYVLISSLHQPDYTVPYFFSIYAGTWLTAITFYLCHFRKKGFYKKHPEIIRGEHQTKAMPSRCISDALCTIQKIGVSMILFSILCHLLMHMPIRYTLIKIINAGICEQTTGIYILSISSLSDSIKLILSSVFCSFGGIAIAAQTAGIIAPYHLSMKHYLCGKMIHGMYTVLILLIYTVVRSFFCNLDVMRMTFFQ